jgi:hypothetical protein
MNRKFAAVLVAATMLTAPAFAAGVNNVQDKPITQTATPHKTVKTSSVKKHRVHARVSHHKVRHAKQVKAKHVSHAKIQKNGSAAANTKQDKTTVGIAPTKN